MTKSSARKVATRKARAVKPNATSKGNGKARDKHHKTAPTLAAQKVRRTSRATAPKVTVDPIPHRNAAAQFEQFPDTQLPDTFRVLAAKNVAQTRELYGRSKDTLQAVLESWQKSFGAAGQGATQLNRRIIDVADRNIDAVFDLATGLAGAKSFADVMASHAVYWRKQISNLSAQAEEVRAPSTKRTSSRSTERR
jgi:hypothetical protein